MRRVFADTSYWIALFNPEDEWSKGAARATQSLGEVHLVTTQDVLTEFLNFFAAFGLAGQPSGFGSGWGILTSKDVTVIAQTPDSFLAGLDLYESSRGCNQTDCAERVRHAGGRHWGYPERPHGLSEGRV